MKNKKFNFKKGETQFVPFIMGGYPDLATTKKLLLGLADIGADIIELGVPYSDPLADGATNIAAATHAVEKGVTLLDCLNLIGELRSENFTTPIVLFSYYNPILQLGLETFADIAHEKGVDAVLLVDLPLEEFDDFYHLCQEKQIGNILLISPTTHSNRLEKYQQYDLPFVYYVSRLGVTGAQTDLSVTLENEIAQVRKFIKQPMALLPPPTQATK